MASHTKQGSITTPLFDFFAATTPLSESIQGSGDTKTNTGGQSSQQDHSTKIGGEETKYEEYKEIEIEIRETKILLKNSREKVAHLEQNVKSAKDDKFRSENRLIKQLQEEQNKILSAIASVKESKYRLLRTAGVEMDRLRSIIRILQEQIKSIKSGTLHHDAISPQTVTNYMQYNSNSVHLQSLGLENLLQTATNFDTTQSSNKHYATGFETPAPDFLEEDTIGNTPGGPTPMGPGPEEEKNGSKLQSKSTETEEDEEEEEEEDDPFPHNDYSRIDFRTLKPGDGKTYPLAYSVVKFKYMGYIHHRDTGRWEQFTHNKTTNRVYSTRLGATSQVPGFEEALLTMSVGEQAKVWVPSRLGYGVYGAGSLVPPYSDLVFIITLLAVEEDNEGSNSHFQNGLNNQGLKQTGANDFENQTSGQEDNVNDEDQNNSYQSEPVQNL